MEMLNGNANGSISGNIHENVKILVGNGNVEWKWQSKCCIEMLMGVLMGAVMEMLGEV